MKQLLIATLIVLFLATGSAIAASVHQCEDEQGNRTFQKHCPPGSTSISQKNYKGDAKTEQSHKDLPALILYRVPDCDVCDEMQEFINAKNLPMTQKDIKGNGELQQELRDKTGGDLRVPVLLLGEKTVKGFDESNLISALTEAGYIEKEEVEKEVK